MIKVNLFFQLDGGLTVEQPYWYVIYYVVIAAFLGLALLFGRRADRHDHSVVERQGDS